MWQMCAETTAVGWVESRETDETRLAATSAMLDAFTPARELQKLRVVPERLEVGFVENHVAEVGVHLQRVRQILAVLARDSARGSSSRPGCSG